MRIEADALQAPLARQINTAAPLSGGGDLSADLTLSIDAATTAAAGIVQLNDSLASTSASQALTANQGKILKDNVDLKAPLVSPAFTGIPTVPTAVNGTNNTQSASTAFVTNQFARKINTTAPLSGGGNLSADLTLSINAATTAAAGIVQLNDSLASTSASQALTANQGKILKDNVDLKAPLARQNQDNRTP